MKVRARNNVKDLNGWHMTGEVFETEEDLGNSVEVLEAPKQLVIAGVEPETETRAEEPKAEEPKAEKPKTARRKK